MEREGGAILQDISVCNRMSEVVGRLLGSLSPWPGKDSEISGSFQSGFRDSSYDNGGWDVELQDHYGDHSGYQT